MTTSVEKHLLFAVLAFEDDLIDLQQLTAACRAWAGDKSKPLADLLVERGWVTTEHRQFLEEKAERKLDRYQNDPRVTLNSVTRGDVCDALRKEVDDSEVRQSLSSWPSDAPVLLETIGETLDESQRPKTRYTWISEVGAGGLGKVWLARDNDLSREVALKEIKPGSASSEAVRRLIKEAQITGQLQHPGIVPVYEVSHDGRPFYTMKLVRGETLSQAIREHHEQKQAGKEDPLSERRLLSIFLNVCDAIAYAHSRGVIHRDLKPDNIVLGEYGEAIVLDWGLARQVSSDDEDSAPIVVTEGGQTEATKAGATPGTPAYMAPEQASGRVEHMDERTDIYGLGGILFEILTGQPPHRVQKVADSASSSTRVDSPLLQSPVAALLHRIATGETPRVRSIDETISVELEAICATAMAKHRQERYQTARGLKAALLEFQVHVESVELAARANDDLATARQCGHYDDFSRARFGFETALEQWPDNARAAEGLKETVRDYSRAAFDRGDFELAVSLLDAADPDQAGLVITIKTAVGERTSRMDRIRRLRRFGFAASLAIAVLASVAAGWINSERSKALTAQQEEAIQRGIAQKKEQDAQIERRAAVAARKTAEIERQNAVAAQNAAKASEMKARVAELDAKREADHARRNLKIAEQNAYNSDMLLVQREWNDSHIDQFRELLDRYRDRDDLKRFEWGFWYRLAHSDQLTLKGQSSTVYGVAFSPDGTRLATANWDRTVKVWDAATGQEELTLEGHTGSVISVAFSPDGAWIASAAAGPGVASAPGEVKLWDAATGREKHSFAGHTDAVRSVSFDPEGTRIASASDDQTVRVWDAVTGRETLTLKGHTSDVRSVTFSSDGSRIASASWDQTVRVWDAATGQEALTFKGHTNAVCGVAFSPDGTQLASSSGAGTVKLWDAATGQEKFTLKGHADAVSSVAFSPDGTLLASASYDRTVKVWSAVTGEETVTLKGHARAVNCVSFSADGTRLATASDDRTVKVWGAITRQETLTLSGHLIRVVSVSFSADGTRLATASRDGTVRVWNAATGEETRTLEGHTDDVKCVSFSPDGQRLASGGGNNFGQGPGELKVWDAATGREELTLKGHTDCVTSVAFSPDGTLLASASVDKTVKLWDVATGQETRTLEGRTGSVSSVAFNSDGTRLASGAGGTVKVWDAATGQETLTLKGHNTAVQSVAFSPDGMWIASAAAGRRSVMEPGEIKLWDAFTGQEKVTLKGHTNSVTSVAFSPDGRLIASASVDKTVKLWDSVTGQETLTLEGHTGYVNSVAFNPDGTRLASASSDRTAKVWDASPWTPGLRTQSEARELLTVHRDRVKSLEALRAAILSDETISDMVRKKALDWAELFWKNRRSEPE